MLPIANFREEKERLVKGLIKRNVKDAESLVNRVLELDLQRRETQKKRDEALAEANTLAKEIGALMKSGNKDGAEQIKGKSGTLKAEAQSLGETLDKTDKELQELLYTIPNIPHESVPTGKGSEDNIIAHEHGVMPSLAAGAQPHWDLIKKYDIIDFDLGNKITGAGFPVYKGKGARLQRALINFFLDEATKVGYTEIQAPILVNRDSGYGTGNLPDKDGQMYHATTDDLFLIPTAEVPITNIYRDEILDETHLPVKNVGYTPCFRREAGSWGAHVRGLNRLHQFDKVEIVQIRKPEESYKALEEMCGYVQGLLEKLELPYRKLRLCGGDMGFTSALTFDMEVYAAAQQRWLEVSSVSNFEAFQANRLKLRYKNASGKTELLHTLNGSALALPRIVAAILENNQSEKGISIPKVLVPYTGFDKID